MLAVTACGPSFRVVLPAWRASRDRVLTAALVGTQIEHEYSQSRVDLDPVVAGVRLGFAVA